MRHKSCDDRNNKLLKGKNAKDNPTVNVPWKFYLHVYFISRFWPVGEFFFAPVPSVIIFFFSSSVMCETLKSLGKEFPTEQKGVFVSHCRCKNNIPWYFYDWDQKVVKKRPETSFPEITANKNLVQEARKFWGALWRKMNCWPFLCYCRIFRDHWRRLYWTPYTIF